MKLHKFLKGVEEASYIIYVNQGNDHLCAAGRGNPRLYAAGRGTVILSGEGIYIRDMIVSDLEGVIDEPDEFGSTAGHFKIGDVQLDITIRK